MKGSVVVVLTLVISFKNTLEGRYLHLSRNFPLGYIPRKCSAAFEHMYMHMGYSHFVNSHFVNSHFVNSHLVNFPLCQFPFCQFPIVDKAGIDEVGS